MIIVQCSWPKCRHSVSAGNLDAVVQLADAAGYGTDDAAQHFCREHRAAAGARPPVWFWMGPEPAPPVDWTAATEVMGALILADALISGAAGESDDTYKNRPPGASQAAGSSPKVGGTYARNTLPESPDGGDGKTPAGSI